MLNIFNSAGQDSEARSNRRLNFLNTTTKLSIPHEFVQRSIQTKKTASATAISNISHHLEPKSSLDSAPPHPVAGKIHSFFPIFKELFLI